MGVRVQRVQRVQKVQRVKVGGCAANMNKTFTTGLRPMENREPPWRAWKCTPSAACGGVSPRESVSHDSQSPKGSLRIVFACHPGGGDFSGSFLLSYVAHCPASIVPPLSGGKVVP